MIELLEKEVVKMRLSPKVASKNIVNLWVKYQPSNTSRSITNLNHIKASLRATPSC